MVTKKPASPVLQTSDSLNTGLECLLPFSQGSGNALDLKASNHGLLKPAAVWGSDAQIGDYVQCADGSGSEGWIDIAAHASMNTGIRTIAMWYRISVGSYGVFRSLVSSWSPTNKFALDYDNGTSDPSLWNWLCVGSSTQNVLTDTTVLADDDSWHLVVLMGGDGETTIYHDKNKYTTTDAGAFDTAAAQITNICTLNSSLSFALKAKVAFFAQWSRKLILSEADSLFDDPWRVITSSAASLGDVGVASAEAVGAETIASSAATLGDAGVASAEAVGAEAVAAGPVALTDAGIASSDAVGQESIAAPGISLVLNASRTTIVAGETVHFDTVGTTSTLTTQPFRDIFYSWDSQDTTNVGQTGFGPVWAHVFRTPGTYLVALEGRDRHGNVETWQVSITVLDPDVVYSGTKTVVVATDGVFTNKPTGAQELTTSDWATAIAAAGRDKRLLIKKGQTLTTTAGASINTSTGTDPALIWSWGSGADPIIDWTATPTGAANFLQITGGNIAIGGLDFRYTGATHTQQHIPIAGSGVVTNVSVFDCKSNAITAPMPQFADSGSGATNSYIGVHYHVCTNTDGAADWMASFQGGDYYALIGNDVDRGGHHIIRHTYGSYLSVFDNDFRVSHRVDKHHFKGHSRTYSTSSDISRYWSFGRNRYQQAGNAIKVAIGPQNSAVDERVQDIVVDGDKLDLSLPQWGYGHFLYGVANATIRNCVYNGKTQTDFYGVGVGRRGVEPSPTGIEVYHGSVYSTGSGGSIFGIEVGTVGETPIVKNFIVDATAATTAAVASGTITGGGSLVGDAKFTNPATEDFSLQATSLALDAGVVVDVVNSFNGAWRIVNGGDTADAGAYEEGSAGTALGDVGVPSAEALGTETIVPGAAPLTDAGVASGAQVGQESVSAGALALQDAGVASGAQVGQEAISGAGSALGDVGVPSGAALGTETMTPGAAALVDAGIPSGEASGQESLAPGAVTLVDVGIASSADVGMEAISVAGLGVQTVFLVGRLYDQVPALGRLYDKIPMEGQV